MSHASRVVVRSFNTEAEWLAARAPDVTSTEASALFGLSPYATAFELFHRKAGNYSVAFEETERTLWGKRLQDTIAEGAAADNGWELIPEPYRYTYAQHPDVPGMGSSYDRFVLDPARGYGMLEIKNVDALIFKNNWVDDAEAPAAPPHIELQLQHQLEVFGLKWGAIAALVGGNRLFLIIREADDRVAAGIRARITKFWADVKAKNPPPPDFNADAQTIAHLYGFAEPGKVMVGADVPPRLAELAALHAKFSKQKKDGTDGLEAVSAEVKTILGDHESAFGQGFKILATVTADTVVQSFTRKGFRSVRIYHTKEKSK